MGLFTDSISQILTTQNLQNVSSRLKPGQVAQIVRQSSTDSVYFSQEAKNLFSIFEGDTFFDTVFGLPANLSQSQQQELSGIQKQLQLLLPSATTAPKYAQLYDYFSDYMKRFVDEVDSQKMEKLEDALKAYTLSKSVNNLFGTNNTTTQNDIFTTLGNGNFSRLFAATLTSDEQQQLSKLSIQLNRLFFSNTKDTFSPLLEQYNTIYGLNSPDENVLFKATNFFDKRNLLFADLLQNKEAV